MKKTIVMILLLLLTNVWSIVCAGLQDKQSLVVVSSTEVSLCTPTLLPIADYEFEFPRTDTTTNLLLEYFDMLQCTTQQTNLLLLPSPVVPAPIYDTICSGETYTWNGKTYSKPGTYTDTLQNIHGCDSIVTLHLHVLPDPPLTITVNGVIFKMMRVRAGTFMMGATPEQGTDALPNEKPAHQVTLTRDYFIGETMLTQELWTAVMGTTIQEEEAKGTGEKNLGYGPNYPMYCLSYNDCLNFVKALSDSVGLEFRMPTEAEWEYAARGGHLSRGYKYPGSNDPFEVAWSIENDPQKKLHPVKLLKPNELGLYDMAGNVWEYIYDFRRTYTAEPQVNPMGDINGNKANIRGGSTAWNTGYNRVSFRNASITLLKSDKSARRAFRFVLDADRVIGEDNTTYQAYDTICAGESYEWNGKTYSKPGSYTDTLSNIYGCDSIVTLHLEVLPDPPLTFTVNGVSFKMMRVRAGTFVMGATPEQGIDAPANEKPAHQVTLTRDYFMAETILTQELWTAVMGTTVQEEEIKSIGKHEGLGYGAKYPMYCISYYDCLNFIERLNQLTGITFRMPTEAEWEYAARGGHLSRGYKYPGSNNAIEVAWNVDRDPDNKLHEVKQLLPNELGLYDMAGNTWEWVYDNHRTYTEESQIDPIGDTLSTAIYIRGGSTYYPNTYNRVSSRGIAFEKTFKKQRIAFRFVLDADRVIGEDNTTYQAYDTICAGDTYTWEGDTYTESGAYTKTLQNIYGCDSIVTLNLTVLPDPPKTFTVNGVSFNMMRVRAGTFIMGATPEQGNAAQANEKPAHQVTLTRDYFIGETMLTQELWTAVMGTTIQEEEIAANIPAVDRNLGYFDNYPMYTLSYNKCLEFIDKLNTMTGLTFRLPTEAEWEYAARGGQLSRGYKYPGSNNPDEVAWTNNNSDRYELHEVKLLKPNELGLYDMAGNIWEWVLDHNRPYTNEAQVNPIGDLTSDKAFIRGCSTYWEYQNARVSCRGQEQLKTRRNTRISCRLVLDADRVIGEDNTTYQAYDTICAGDTITWNGKTYTKPGSYTDTLQNIYGCDSIVTLHLEVNPTYEVHDTIVACDSYTFNPFNSGDGITIYESGTYKDTTASISGCDSVFVLHLTINHSILQEYHKTAFVSYTWKEGKTYSQSGVYYDSLSTINGCDSIEILYLNILPPTEYFVYDTLLCHGVTCEWRNKQLTTEGTYNDTVKNQLNCDSLIYILNLEYLPDVVFVEEDTLLCYGATCEWRNMQLTTEGTYKDTVKNQLNCDSVIYILNLEYLPDVVFVEEDTLLCYGATCEWRNMQLTTEGTYKDTVKNQLNGDSIIYILNLEYLPNVVFIEEDTLLCYGATCEWRNMQLTTADTYKDTVKNQLNCDSLIYILNLKYLPDVEYIEEDTLLCYGTTCEWRDLQLTTAGTYKDTVKNQLNGDSIIYILNLEYLPDVEFIEEDTLLCYGVTCEWRGLELESAGTYNDTVKNQLDCDSLIYILHLEYLPDVESIIEDTLLCYGVTCEWRSLQLNTAGTYKDTVKNQLDCDSVIYILNLEYLPDVVFVEEDTLLCHGVTCEWRNMQLTTAGRYNDTVKNQLDCDSVIYILHLEYLPDVVYVEEDTLLCHGVTCEWRNLQLTTAGTYHDTVKNQLDCDSAIYILNLDYLPDVVFVEEDTLLCHGATCNWRGLEFESAGTYNDTVKNQLDCDSVIYILNLKYLPDVEYIEEDTLLCYGAKCEWRGLEFESAGTYNDTVKNQLDCDSLIYILHLEYLPDVESIIEDTLLCYGVTCEWRSLQLNTAGTYKDTVKNQLNGDSIIYILNLEYLPDVVFVEEDTLLCHGVTCEWQNMQLTTADTYKDTIKNQLDCDSLIYILNLKYLPDVEYIEEDTLLCHGVTCEWRGLELESAGTYNDTVKNQLDCDSLIYILHLEYLPDVESIIEDTLLCYGVTCEWRSLQLNTAGTYKDTVKNQLNGDSIIYILNLEYLPDVVFVEEDTLLCHGVTCEWRNMQLTTEGTYNDTVKNQLDCDSVIYILHLEYLPDVVFVEEDTLLCHGITCNWRGLEFDTAGTYNDTVKNQLDCDSVIYILHLEYLPDVEFIEEDTLLCHGVTCNWRGVELENAGTYNDTVKNQLDCDSVIYILNLAYLPDVEYIEEDTLLCYGVTCEWRGLELESAGTYNDTVKNQLDCDSVIYILNLEYLPDVEFIEEDTLLCYGITCNWRGLELESAGTYNDTVKNQLDCDSVIYILNLAYLPDVVYVEEDTLLCYGATCEWRSLQLNTAGTYKDTVKNQLNCDSVIYILNLAYLPDVEYIEEDTLLCHGVTCEWRGLELESAGTYNDTVKNQLDCDSVIYILNLAYLPDVEYIEEDTLLCHGVTCEWRGLELESAGTYNDTVKHQLNCDSVIYILHLDYLPQVQHFITDTFLCYGEVCDWRGVTYKESGIYHDTIRNILHCDSLIYTLNLVIYPEIPITHIIDTIAGAEYHWNDQIYTHGGDYTVTLPAITGCDSVVILHLVDNHAAIDTVIVYEQCAGSGEQEVEILTQGYIEQIVLNYSPQAQAAGLRDTVMMLSSTDDIYTIYYDDVRAGVHEVRAVGLFHGKEVASYPFTLTYLYPNTIFEQRYNDLIAVLTHDYNGGYDFSAFQWYKDGVLLPGETHSYLNQSLSFESEYSVLLTNTDGLQLMSCPIIAEDKSELSVYPTILKQGELVNCHMTNNNTLYIHDAMGKIIQELQLEEGITAVALPIVSGVYLLRFVSNDHIERTFKVIVQ